MELGATPTTFSYIIHTVDARNPALIPLFSQCFGFTIHPNGGWPWDFLEATSLPEIYQLTWHPGVLNRCDCVTSLHGFPLGARKVCVPLLRLRIGQKNRQKTGWNWFCCMQARKNPAMPGHGVMGFSLVEKKDGAKRSGSFFLWGKRIVMKMNPSPTKVMVPWIFDLRSSFSYGEPSVHQKYEMWFPLLHKNDKSQPTISTKQH